MSRERRGPAPKAPTIACDLPRGIILRPDVHARLVTILGRSLLDAAREQVAREQERTETPVPRAPGAPPHEAA